MSYKKLVKRSTAGEAGRAVPLGKHCWCWNVGWDKRDIMDVKEEMHRDFNGQVCPLSLLDTSFKGQRCST